MNEHFDRFVTSVAAHRPTRRSVNGGMLAMLTGGLLAGRARPMAAARMQADECDLGCEDSTCGEVPPTCPIYPPDNIWNTPITSMPLAERSADYVASIGLDTGMHPDFGSGLYEGSPLGIPFVRVSAEQPMVAVTLEYAEESDPGPYPIPADAPVEGGSCGEGDRHVIVVQEGTCLLYELYNATQQPDGSWQASSGARFDLASNDLRTAEWTSADAAGMAILPGLVRYEEIAAGVIPHALRFTAATTQDTYVWPARHQAGASSDLGVPPMGQRFRLKADLDMSTFSPVNQIILQALKTYGMLLADNGSDLFISGVPDDRWDNDDLHALQEGIQGGDFEAVDCSSLMVDPDSGQAVSG